MFSSLLHAFAHQIDTRPCETALIVRVDSAVQAFTWRQLGKRACGQAEKLSALLDSQPAALRCVGYASDNSLGDVLTALACPIIGAMEVPVDHRLGSRAKRQASSVGGLWLDKHDLTFGNDRFANDPLQRIQAAVADIRSDASALILWTSGTTKDPKAVTLTHRNLLGNAQAKLTAVPNAMDDIRLTSLPLCHAYARTCDLGTWLVSGCTLALGLGFDAWRHLGPNVRPTVANVVPSLAKLLSEADIATVGIDRLRLLGCGGAAMSAHDFQAWRDRGVTVIQGYGLTESSPVICSATPDNATAGLVGKFVDGWDYEIRDHRLFVRGCHVMAGYWKDENATKQRVVNGWLDTGDLVKIDPPTGQLQILGRADDVIVLDNGHKVHPQSIEQEIRRIEGVRHALILAKNGSIEAWIDADKSNDWAAQIEQHLQNRPRWERPAAVHLFNRPLSSDAGDLTVKGTIQREQVTKLTR
jgi:long-chain acyl-CoA synthetase